MTDRAWLATRKGLIDMPAPAYPPQPPETSSPAWKLGLIWNLL